MRYLLDVNVLVALGHTGHVHHSSVIKWFAKVVASATGFHTCAITELGFVRVAVTVGLQPDIPTACAALEALKASSRVPFELIPDVRGVAHLPEFVATPGAVTDGHLLDLARSHSMELVTLDRGIPGATCIVGPR